MSPTFKFILLIEYLHIQIYLRHTNEKSERLAGERYKAKIAKELGMKKNSAGKWKMPSPSGGGVGGFGKFSTINRSSRSGNKLKLPPKDFI